MMDCPLCRHGNHTHFHHDTIREYRRCARCMLVFVPPTSHLSQAMEKAEYDKHQNDPNDPGYRRFLARMLDPICERIPPPALGLDFGCGPGPALASMFESHGYTMACYDKFYAKHPAVLQMRYNFITLTETAEHLADPGTVLARLWGLLLPGACLGIMTKRVSDPHAFRRWHYIRDITHIAFFSEQTFEWLAASWRAGVDFPQRDIVLFDAGRG